MSAKMKKMSSLQVRRPICESVKWKTWENEGRLDFLCKLLIVITYVNETFNAMDLMISVLC